MLVVLLVVVLKDAISEKIFRLPSTFLQFSPRYIAARQNNAYRKGINENSKVLLDKRTGLDRRKIGIIGATIENHSRLVEVGRQLGRIAEMPEVQSDPELLLFASSAKADVDGELNALDARNE